MRKIDYSKGMKVCMSCDRAIFVGLIDFHCPCYNKSLCTKPQYYGERTARRSGKPPFTGTSICVCYIRLSAVMPSITRAFFRVTPKALTSARRAILTSAFSSFRTGTFS